MMDYNLQIKMTALNQASAKVDAVSGSVDKLDNSTKKSNKSLKNFGKSWESFGSRVNVLGQRMSGAITLPLIMFGKSAIDTAIVVDKAWARFNKIFSGTKEDAEGLKKESKELSEEFGINIEDVFGVMGEFNKAGIDSKDVLIKLSKKALETSILFDTDLKSAFEGVKSVMFGFGLNVDETRDALATINIIGDKTTTSEQDILDVMQKSGGVFKQNSISIRDAAAMTSLLAQSNIKGTIAGNMFKTVISKINDATPKATKEMKNFGIDVSGNAFRTASFVDKLKMLHDKQTEVFSSGSKVKIANYNTAMKDLVGLRQLNRFSILVDKVDQLKEVTDMASDETKNLEFWNKQLAVVLESTPKKLEIMNQMYRNQQIILGNKLLPIKMELLKIMTKLINKFNELSPGTQDFIIKLGLIAAAIGPVLVYVGLLVTAFGFMFTTAGLVITGMIGFAILLSVAWAKNWNGIQDKTKNVLNNIRKWTKEHWDEIQNKTKNVLNNIRKWTKEHWDEISSIFKGAWKIIKSIFDIGWGILKGAYDIAMEIFTRDWSLAWEGLKLVVKSIFIGKSGEGGIVGIINGAIDILKNSIKIGTQDMINSFSKMSTVTQSILLGLGIYFSAWWLARKLEILYIMALYAKDWILAMAKWSAATIGQFVVVGKAAMTLQGVLSLLSVPIVIAIGIGSIIAAIKAAKLLGEAVNEASDSNDANIKKINELLSRAKELKGVNEEERKKLIKAADVLGRSNAKVMSDWAGNSGGIEWIKGVNKALGLASGGLVYAANGYLSQGKDTVPAMLSPGEMVLNKSQQTNLFDMLSGRNSVQTAGGPTININVGTMVASRGEQRAFARKIEELISEDKGRY